MYRTIFWWDDLGECHGNMYNIASPGSIQDPWGWCNGMTRRDGTGREVGEGVQDGEHVYARGRLMLMCGRTNTIL